MINPSVARAFDKAAHSYDAVAEAQAQVAETLVAGAVLPAPRTILDIGCGTGFVLAAAAKRWPAAELTGLDIAPAMLSEAKRKMPGLVTICADAGTCDLSQRFDLIFSSMMLHWFAEPAKMLRHWQGWLAPQGVLCVAVPVAGSLGAWSDLCEAADIGNGLWRFPPADFADDLVCGSALRQHAMTYSSVLDFLRALKRSGGGTPREDHQPTSSPSFRKLVREAPRPFRISYKVLYAEVRRSSVNGVAMRASDKARAEDIGR
jgi:malonyl-CoA O-methyltransferase